MIHKLKTEYENLQLNEEIPTVSFFICFGTKFKLPQDFIQFLKVITVLGFILHWKIWRTKRNTSYFCDAETSTELNIPNIPVIESA